MSVSRSYDSGPKRDAFPRVWGQVPPQNIYFTGREELLTQLREALTAGQAVVLPHTLRGMPGVGKTQLAVEYAYRNRAAYDVIWWIAADQPPLVQASLAGLAPHLNLPRVTDSGVREAANAVLDALRRGDPYDKWLLIFDNADEPEDLSNLLPHGPGHVLITSRNHRWQGVADSIEVETFTRSESIQFLTKRVPKAIASAAADELANQLGDLPLALEQAGALQRETGMSASEYLELLGQQTRKLLEESKPSEYPVSMTAAWRLSVARLTGAQSGTLELLRCCAFFGPDPIPRDVFRRGIRQTGSQLSQVLSDPIQLARAIRDLGRFALATIDPANRTIQVHRLIQALLRDELAADARGQFRHEVHLLLAGAAPANPDDETQWPRFAELIPHLGPARVTESREPEVRDFALRMIRFMYRTGQYAAGREFAEECLRQWTDHPGPDHPDVITAQRHLGDILRASGEYQAAFTLTAATLERARRVLPADSEVTLALMNPYSADLRAQGDFTAARSLDSEVARRLEDSLGPDHPLTLRAYNNLAIALCFVSDYAGARDLLQRTFVTRSRATQGVSKTEVLVSWSNLSRAVRLAGEYAEARLLAEDAYEFGRKEVGADHLWTLRTGKALSIAQRVAGDPVDEMAAFARDLLAQFERVLGSDHPETLATATNLANALRVSGDHAEALEILRSAADGYRKAYQPAHPYLYGHDSNIAQLLRLHGDPAAARELDDAALNGLAGKLGRDHDYPLIVALNLASDLSALGDARAAAELGTDTVSRLRTVLGADHPVTIGGTANLALDLAAAGEADRADQLAGEAQQRFARTLGVDHPYPQAAMRGERLEFDFDPAPF